MDGEITNLSTVKELAPGEFEHTTRFIYDEAPTLEHVHRLRMANMARKGWTDERKMRFRARIPAFRVWEAENVLGYNLNERRDFEAYLMLHPEFIVSPDSTGADGRIIIKGSD
jgi:hypothetical protein